MYSAQMCLPPLAGCISLPWFGAWVSADGRLFRMEIIYWLSTRNYKCFLFWFFELQWHYTWAGISCWFTAAAGQCCLQSICIACRSFVHICNGFIAWLWSPIGDDTDINKWWKINLQNMDHSENNQKQLFSLSNQRWIMVCWRTSPWRKLMKKLILHA